MDANIFTLWILLSHPYTGSTAEDDFVSQEKAKQAQRAGISFSQLGIQNAGLMWQKQTQKQVQHFWVGVPTRVIFYSKTRNKQGRLPTSKEDTSGTSSGLRVKHVPFGLRSNFQKEYSDRVTLCPYTMIEALPKGLSFIASLIGFS